MTTARMVLASIGVAGLVALAAAGGRQPARAENTDLRLIKGGGTPPAIEGQSMQGRLNCPLLVKPSEAALQPLSLLPEQVEAKNKLGCLSSNDATYGPDGCPSKLCGAERGVIKLPAGSVTSP